MKKSVLLIHRYFLPDTPPYATMLSYIAEHIAKSYAVSVLSAQPSYKNDVAIDQQPSQERVNGYDIARLDLPKEDRSKIRTRLFATVVYLNKVFFHIIKKKPSVVMVSTAPAVLSGYVVSVAAKVVGADFYYHCQDIHPEIARLSGQVKQDFIYKLLQKLDIASCKRANRIIVISTDMKKALVERGVKENKISVIGNFALGTDERQADLVPEVSLSKEHFNILFAGNVGKFQALDRLFELANLCRDEKKIRFYIMGSGTYLKTLKEKVKSSDLNNLIFFPHQPVAVARQVMQEAQLCVVSLNEQIYKYAYPSKTLTYLAEGRPLLGLIEDGSQLSHLIDEEEIGVTFSHQEIAKGKEKIINIMTDKAMYQQCCENAKDFFANHLMKDEILKQWDSLFEGFR